jgi:hypothetical protein
MVGLPIFAAIKPAWLNKFSFWLSVLQLLSLYLGLSGLKTAPKSLVLQATAKAFPIGADSSIAARCFGNRKDL